LNKGVIFFTNLFGFGNSKTQFPSETVNSTIFLS